MTSKVWIALIFEELLSNALSVVDTWDFVRKKEYDHPSYLNEFIKFNQKSQVRACLQVCYVQPTKQPLICFIFCTFSSIILYLITATPKTSSETKNQLAKISIYKDRQKQYISMFLMKMNEEWIVAGNSYSNDIVCIHHLKGLFEISAAD